MYADLLPVLLGLAAVTLQESSVDLPVYRVPTTTAAAGQLLDPASAAWNGPSPVEWGPDPYPTRFRALRDAEGLWLRFDAGDEAPWHTHTERDSPLWEEEVVEIFVDPDGDGHNYAELEISPAGVVTDLLVFDGWPEMHTEIGWDLQGLTSRVLRAEDGDWAVIAHVPWSAFAALPGTAVALPPAPGDRWRFNLFRIKRPHGPEEPGKGVILAAWSPVPGPSFHQPDRFAWMEFE